MNVAVPSSYADGMVFDYVIIMSDSMSRLLSVFMDIVRGMTAW